MIWRQGDLIQGPVLPLPGWVTSIRTLLFLIWKIVARVPPGPTLVGLSVTCSNANLPHTAVVRVMRGDTMWAMMAEQVLGRGVAGAPGL